MSAFKPLGGGFVRHATLWIDSSAGIVTGYVRAGILRIYWVFSAYPYHEQVEFLVCYGNYNAR